MSSLVLAQPRFECFSPRAYQADFYQHGFYLCLCGSLEQLEEIVEEIGALCAHDRSGVTVWDIKPDNINDVLQPRSRTADEFTFHTDASFEDPPPRGIGLYVVHADRLGGGVTRLVDWVRVAQYLTEADKAILHQPFPMRVPPEFVKDYECISAPILMANDGIRYRREMLEESLITRVDRDLLNRLDEIINMPENSFDLLLPTGVLICLDNYRILHARTAIEDPERHLVRFRYSL